MLTGRLLQVESSTRPRSERGRREGVLSVYVGHNTSLRHSREEGARGFCLVAGGENKRVVCQLVSTIRSRSFDVSLFAKRDPL